MALTPLDLSKSLDRTPVWNAFFRLAWSEAKAVFEAANHCQVSGQFDAGPAPVLDEDEFHVLALVVMCNLAIEARANHLIHEAVERKLITEDVADAARWLPPRHKWFLLPTLWGRPTQLDATNGPHQAVAQICELRNDFIHVNYEAIKSRLGNKGEILSFYRRFCEAIDHMNVILGRNSDSNPAVVGKGKFACG